MNRIALLEDHERMAALVVKALGAVGIEVDVYATIAHAADGFAQIAYPLLVLDRSLPDGDGLELVKQLRARGILTPCLMLTARDALHDRVAGLEAGADDYLPKPFSMEELVARVRALMRRPPQLQSLSPEYAGILVDPEAGRMHCGEESVSLAAAEMQLMLSLVRAAGKTVRRSALEAAAWGLSEPVTPNALDVALHRLRRKLMAIDSALQIANIRGHGYALQDADAAGQIRP
ncbi:response regulator transcription factor [Herbaspirillum sp. RV1423]|uniref:response regulator transcription factor n=1 Tax=Herbaspirillum sp. RV1423 TaxID=1443993 RepID=UPI0004BB9FBD|nr:response regulator transcription factor [Herbaspirillum sp. RV1423]